MGCGSARRRIQPFTQVDRSDTLPRDVGSTANARRTTSGGRALMRGLRRHWAAALVISISLLVAFPMTGSALHGAHRASGMARAGTSSLPAAQQIKVTWQSTPPVRTPARLAQLRAAEARADRPGPDLQSVVPAHLRAYGPTTSGSAVLPSARNLLAAPTDFGMFRNTIVPFAGATPYDSSFSSNTQEPSIDSNGKYIFATGNWYATMSTNNGATWSYLDPFVVYSGVGPDLSDFCCDQVSLYDSSRNQQFWLMMGVDGKLKLGRSAGDDLVNWCYWTMTAADFGGAPTDEIDYNDMALSNDFLYVASNVFDSGGLWARSSIIRMSLDSLASCGSIGISYATDAAYFTFKPVQGATTTMYWGSDGGGTPGSSFRLYSWVDGAGSYSWYDRAVPAFIYYSRDGGQDCGGGPVANWCQYADSRVLGGYVARGIVGFSFNAKQDAAHPFPYTRVVRFNETTKNYVAATDYWTSAFAIQFMSWAPNGRGNLGATFAFGGGNASTYWFPGSAQLILDDHGQTINYVPGGSNACASGGIYRWGDYLTIRPAHPGDLAWVATGMRNINGGPCGGGYSEIHNYVFGRERDRESYKRWADS